MGDFSVTKKRKTRNVGMGCLVFPAMIITLLGLSIGSFAAVPSGFAGLMNGLGGESHIAPDIMLALGIFVTFIGVGIWPGMEWLGDHWDDIDLANQTIEYGIDHHSFLGVIIGGIIASITFRGLRGKFSKKHRSSL